MLLETKAGHSLSLCESWASQPAPAGTSHGDSGQSGRSWGQVDGGYPLMCVVAHLTHCWAEPAQSCEHPDGGFRAQEASGHQNRCGQRMCHGLTSSLLCLGAPGASMFSWKTCWSSALWPLWVVPAPMAAGTGPQSGLGSAFLCRDLLCDNALVPTPLQGVFGRRRWRRKELSGRG